METSAAAQWRADGREELHDDQENIRIRFFAALFAQISGTGFYIFLGYGRALVMVASRGATMADKSTNRAVRKPAMTIKERRAVKRAKEVTSGEIVRRRKRADRS